MYKTPDINQKDVQCTENNEFSFTNCTMYKFFKTVQLRYDCTEFFVQLYKIKCTIKLDFPCGPRWVKKQDLERLKLIKTRI